VAESIGPTASSSGTTTASHIRTTANTGDNCVSYAAEFGIDARAGGYGGSSPAAETGEILRAHSGQFRGYGVQTGGN
jgi:hypothetical protein